MGTQDTIQASPTGWWTAYERAVAGAERVAQMRREQRGRQAEVRAAGRNRNRLRDAATWPLWTEA